MTSEEEAKVRGAHLPKIAEGGAASVVIVPTAKGRGGPVFKNESQNPHRVRDFRRRAPQTSIRDAFLEMIRCDDTRCQQHGFPSVENRDGGGSRSR